MFKKRTAQKTKAELDTILTQINTQQQYPQNLGMGKGNKNQTNNQNQSVGISQELNESENHQTGTKYDKSMNGKCNVYQIGAGSNMNKRFGLINSVLNEGNQMQFGNIDLVSEGIMKNKSQVHQMVDKNPEQLKEIEDCFAEFINIQKQQENKPLQQFPERQSMQRHHPGCLGQQQDIGPAYTQMIEENVIDDQQDQPQQQKIKPKPLPMVHQVIIQDQSGEQIEICEDYGQISPDSDQSNNSQYFKQSLQNKIIRQALTKRNYDRLKPSLEPEVHSSQKTKLIKKLERISVGSIRKKMLKDLEEQKNRKNDIASEIKHLQEKVIMRKKQMEEQMVNKQKLQQQLQKVKGMIELLFYFGSEIEIKGLKINKLAHLVEDPQWNQKLQLVRNKIRRNRKEYEAKKKNQTSDDIEKQEGSDVEEIGRSKFNEWGNEEEFEVAQDQLDGKEQKNESKSREKNDLIESQEDDDQYIQIDDD